VKLAIRHSALNAAQSSNCTPLLAADQCLCSARVLTLDHISNRAFYGTARNHSSAESFALHSKRRFFLPQLKHHLLNIIRIHSKILTANPIAIMDTVLRQSKSMCPFLKKASPATLRSMSTTVTRHTSSPGGGAMSNLQTMARRCPIMSKALAVQTAKTGQYGLGGAATIGAIRAMSSKIGSGKARLHTSRPQDARAVDTPIFSGDKGELPQLHTLQKFRSLTSR
jgi:hypothetical protein